MSVDTRSSADQGNGSPTQFLSRAKINTVLYIARFHMQDPENFLNNMEFYNFDSGKQLQPARRILIEEYTTRNLAGTDKFNKKDLVQ